MRVFLDTNVLLDCVVKRENRQFSEDAATIMKMGRKGALELSMSILSIPIIAYMMKNMTASEKKAIIQDITSVVQVLPSLSEHVHDMLECPLGDIEDALQLLSAKSGGCDLVVTRDVEGFRLSDLPVITPEDLLSRILE